ncbi:NADH-cytochrome b5 reductase, putative [Plasmodium ovale]|uniref:NADH-cytochrome b5 reductase n=2 Tax=Plasmodium ovale TaxID=36330 RepID=A0A1D3TIQ7_PLAOA|nr:NADH-cytochrome b5 reductase, putative [Plasmodium ovale]
MKIMRNFLGEGFHLSTSIIVSVGILFMSITSFFFLTKNKISRSKCLFHLYSKKHEYEDINNANGNGNESKSEIKGENKNENESKNIGKKKFLNGTIQKLKLCEIVKLTKTVKIFIFSYPYEYDNLGLGICKHIKFYGLNKKGKIEKRWNNKDDKERNLQKIFRSYTPIYIDEKNKHIHFIIRIYSPNNTYIDGGKMSIQLEKLHPNDNIDVVGPYGVLDYKGNNELTYLSKTYKIRKHLVMIAGGTGMTPFFRLINHLLLTEMPEKRDEPIYITFIYANRNEQEILLKPIFDEYDETFTNFKRVYSIDECLNSSERYLYDNIGFLNEELLKKYVMKYEKLNLDIKKKDTLILACGPPPMTSFVQSVIKEKLQMENFITL